MVKGQYSEEYFMVKKTQSRNENIIIGPQDIETDL